MGQRLKKSTVLFAVAAVLALFIGLRVQHLLMDIKQTGVVQVAMVKDTVTIAPFKVIQATDVQVKEVARDSILPDTLYTIQDVVGKRSAMAILPSTMLRKGHLLQTDSLVGVLSNLGKDSLVAIAVPMESEQIGLGKVGEYVTLHGIVRQGTDSALLSIRKVPILERSDQVVTIAVTTEQADALDQVMLGGGKIRMVLNQN